MLNFLISMFILLANVLAVALPIAVIGLSWMPVREEDPIKASFKEGGLRLATLVWCFLFCIVVVPRFTRIFENFGIELPGLTIMELRLTDLRQPVSRIAFALVQIILAGQVALFAWLRHNEDHVTTANRVSICATLMFVLGIAFFVVGFALPLFKLLNDLS